MATGAAGTSVEVTAVMGKGFRPERAPAQQFPTCFIFATGSGISPIKALIESNELEVRLQAPAPGVLVAGD